MLKRDGVLPASRRFEMASPIMAQVSSALYADGLTAWEVLLAVDCVAAVHSFHGPLLL